MKIDLIHILTFLIDFMMILVAANLHYNFDYVVVPIVFCVLAVAVTFASLMFFRDVFIIEPK